MFGCGADVGGVPKLVTDNGVFDVKIRVATQQSMTSSPPGISYGYHLVPLALAWDLGARDWPQDLRLRFANDPANLLAVDGKANQDKGDAEPADWMPPNHGFWCQYSVQFAAVLRGYALPVDQRSAAVLRGAAGTCPVA